METKTVITTIVVETTIPADQLTTENIDRYSEDVYNLIKNETDEGSIIKISIELK